MSPEIFGHQRVGGISRYFAELHSALRANGVDARIIAGCHGNSYITGATATLAWNHGRRRTPRWMRAGNEMIFRAWCAGSGGDVTVHRTYYDWAHRPRCSHLVTTVHDLTPELFADGRRPDALSEMKRRACFECDAICANSCITASGLQRMWGVPASRIWVTPLGVRRIEPSHRDWNAQFGQYLLHVGQRGGYKNGAALFGAFAQSGLSADMCVVCFGGSAPTDVERAQLHELGLESRVHFTGGTDADLAACYRDAAGHVCPSLYEGFGLTVLEAMIQGCPVACSHAGALPEVAGDAAILFDPNCLDSMADALRSLAEARDGGDAIIGRAKARAEGFTWSETARRTLLAYRGEPPEAS